MTAGRRLQRRLEDAGRRLRDRAYGRLAAMWRQGIRPGEEEGWARTFHGLAEWEAVRGTPLAEFLARLPPALADVLRHELAARLDVAEPGSGPSRGGG